MKLNPFKRKSSVLIDEKIMKIREAENCMFIIPEGSKNKAFQRGFRKGLLNKVDVEKQRVQDAKTGNNP